jgi:hypothetical protein
MANEQAPLKNTLKFASEFVVPGGSNFLNGDLKQGAIHLIAGAAAAVLLGPVGVILVGANSFTKATTGHHVHEHLGLLGEKSAAGKKTA